MSLAILGTILLFSLLPAALFLGFWYWAARARRGRLVTNTCERAGATDPMVTWGDVFDAYLHPDKQLFGPNATSSAHDTPQDGQRCPACSTTNEQFASYCGTCCQKLR